MNKITFPDVVEMTVSLIAEAISNLDAQFVVPTTTHGATYVDHPRFDGIPQASAPIIVANTTIWTLRTDETIVPGVSKDKIKSDLLSFFLARGISLNKELITEKAILQAITAISTFISIHVVSTGTSNLVYRESSNVGGSIVQDDDNALLLDEALKSIDSLVPALSLSAPQLIPMQFSAVSISSSSSCSTCSCCSSCSSCSCCSSNSCMLW